MRLAARVAHLSRPAISDASADEGDPASQAGIAAALDRGETHYTDRPGIGPLRGHLARILEQRFEFAVGGGQIVVTCGVTEARFVAIHQICRRGERFATLNRAEVGPVGALNAVTATGIGDPDVRLVHLRSSAEEPTLRTILADIADDVTVLFEVDDGASRFHPSAMPGLGERTITIGDLGRPDWRVGYLAAPKELLPRLRDFKQALTICTTNLSQWAALAWLEDSE